MTNCQGEKLNSRPIGAYVVQPFSKFKLKTPMQVTRTLSTVPMGF